MHMPLDGQLQRMVHIPGDLFSVNAVTAEHVPRLFARNERVVCHFVTPTGPMAVVLVGAMIVASIETPWAGLVAPTRKQVRTSHYGLAPACSLPRAMRWAGFAGFYRDCVVAQGPRPLARGSCGRFKRDDG